MIPTVKAPDETDKKILHGIRHGMTYKEIAYEMNKREDFIKKRTTAMRKYYNCVSNPQLIAHLILEGIIH